jgi:hypothetical protein
MNRHFSGEKEYTVDLSSATAGSYQIITRTDNKLVVKKLFIMK